MANTVSKIACLYAVLGVTTFFFQNPLYISIVSGVGVLLLIFLSVGLDNVFGEHDDLDKKMKNELELLRKEIKELKESSSKQLYRSTE